MKEAKQVKLQVDLWLSPAKQALQHAVNYGHELNPLSVNRLLKCMTKSHCITRSGCGFTRLADLESVPHESARVSSCHVWRLCHGSWVQSRGLTVSHRHHHSNTSLLNSQNLCLWWDKLLLLYRLCRAVWGLLNVGMNEQWACTHWRSSIRPALHCPRDLTLDFLPCACLLDAAMVLSYTWKGCGHPWAGTHERRWALSTLLLPGTCLQPREEQILLNPQMFVYQQQLHPTASCRTIHEIKLFDIPDSQLVKFRTWINYNDIKQPRGGPVVFCVFSESLLTEADIWSTFFVR